MGESSTAATSSPSSRRCSGGWAGRRSKLSCVRRQTSSVDGVRVCVGHEHDLACHASLPEQLVRLSCLGKRKSLRDERLDLLLLKEVEQGDQILSKQCRFQPFEPLDAVGDHPFAAREKPAASDVQPEDCDSTKAIDDDLDDLKSIAPHVASQSGHRPRPSRQDGAPCGNARCGCHRCCQRRRLRPRP